MDLFYVLVTGLTDTVEYVGLISEQIFLCMCQMNVEPSDAVELLDTQSCRLRLALVHSGTLHTSYVAQSKYIFVHTQSVGKIKHCAILKSDYRLLQWVRNNCNDAFDLLCCLRD